MDKNKINPYYVFYFFQTKLGQHRLLINKSQVGVPAIASPLTSIKNILVPHPKLEIQDKIVNLLLTLDKKIELNLKINQILEKISQTIFKSWFIRFDPVRAKSKSTNNSDVAKTIKELSISYEIMDLFPNEFEKSELGYIPKGWQIGCLGQNNFSEFISSGIHKFNGKKIYLATADVKDYEITNTDTTISYEERPSRANMQPIHGSVWFAKMAKSRKILMFDKYSNDVDNYILSTGFSGLKTTSLSHCYIWSFILSDKFNSQKDNLASGGVQISINNQSIKQIKFVRPNDKILSEFSNLTSPIFKKIYYNFNQIRLMEKIKDLLLIKIFSGELDISNLDMSFLDD